MKKTIFIVLLLALASLGSALPPKTLPKTPAKTPVKTPPTTPSTTPAVTGLAGLDSAQVSSELGVSKDCAAALLKIVTSPEFLKCVPLSAFTPILPIVTDPNFLKNLIADPAGSFKKIEPAFVQFSTNFCPAPKCSDKGIEGAVQIISDGCKDDLKSNTVIQLIFGATVFYSPLHDIVCFKSNLSKDKFCWDESLTTIFSLPKSPIKITGNPLLDSIAVSDCKAVCTDCDKSIINTFFNFLNSGDLKDIAKQVLAGAGVDQKVLDELTLGVAVKCGIGFEDGKIPNKP